MSGTAGGRESAAREIELKLACSGPDLTALAAHPFLDGLSAPERLVTAYYDTPDRALRAAGLTLRVREQAGRFVQTVKSGSGGAGLFDRGEWEREVGGQAPEPAAWAGSPAEAVLSAAAQEAEGAGLERLFTGVTLRRVAPVALGASRILATLDEGRIEAPSGEVAFCEVELEIADGGAADLFALAQSLAESVPLRLGVLSKSARGFALIDGVRPGPVKAGPVALPEDASAADAFRAVARACLRHMRLNETAFLEAGRDPEALHQMRVALRRLRSALSLFAPLLASDPRAASLADEIKGVTAPFGAARNLDVFLGETLPTLRRDGPDAPDLDDLRLRAEADRERAYDAVLAILESPQWRGLILDVAGWIEAGAWAEAPEAGTDARAFAARVLERARRRLKRRGRGLKRIDPHTRHRARIAAKKLRYGAEFFAGLYPKGKARRRREAFGAALSDLQDDLGALNDLETARAVTMGLSGGPLPEPDADIVADLLKAAARARRRLLDVEPFWR